MQVIQNSFLDSVSFHFASEMPLLVLVHSRSRPLQSVGVNEYAGQVSFYVHAHYLKRQFRDEEIRTSSRLGNCLSQIKIIQVRGLLVAVGRCNTQIRLSLIYVSGNLLDLRYLGSSEECLTFGHT